MFGKIPEGLKSTFQKLSLNPILPLKLLHPGIYFDCATRRWLLSYTSLLVSCAQCSTKKQSTTSSASSDNELEMRLIGLLSVDIDLETVDVNQCEPASTKPSFSPPLIKTVQPANSYQLNQLNSQQNYQTNRNANQQAISDRLGVPSIDEQPTGEPNTPEPSNDDWLRRLTVRAKEFKEFNYLSSNESQRFLSPLEPIASSQSAFTANNHSTSAPDESYKLSGSTTRLTSRIMLHFEKTNKCHRESSQVSSSRFVLGRYFLWGSFQEVLSFWIAVFSEFSSLISLCDLSL